MTRVREAVILMAGQGSRLRGSDQTILKPFVPVNGQALISYTLEALIHEGISTLNFVVGYESERVIAQLKPLLPAGVSSSFIENRDWKKQNGVSVLSAAGYVSNPFLLAMSDHVFETAVLSRLLDSSVPSFLNVAVDRKLGSIFDLADAMKVRTRDDNIIDIGKNLQKYDAIDTGMFICPLKIFSYLKQAQSVSDASDCSLADGVRLMARDGKVRAIDIGDGWWQDVDTPQMLQHAERRIRKSRSCSAQSALT
jgi:choline kinase